MAEIFVFIVGMKGELVSLFRAKSKTFQKAFMVEAVLRLDSRVCGKKIQAMIQLKLTFLFGYGALDILLYAIQHSVIDFALGQTAGGKKKGSAIILIG